MNNIQLLLRSSVSVLMALIGLVLVNAVTVPSVDGRDRRETSGNLVVSLLPSVPYPNCRFSVGGDTRPFSVTALNIGWSMDWSAQLDPPRPNGAEYVQVVTIKPALGGYIFTPPTSTLYTVLDQNPGATWLIGNEPDSPFQDNLWPEVYAQAYHHLYYLIKQRDPSAQVGAGNIVQPTPLRMLYLDRALNAYYRTYSEWLPTDLWSIHSYILREIDPADPEAAPQGPYEVWGAYIPPGITATRGVLYTYSDMFSQAIFQQRLFHFREWMRDRGYGDKPLYITEYGTLFPYPPYLPGDPEPYLDENGVPMTESRTAAFMTGTFNLLRYLTSADVGHAADQGRLVQRWLWYSVSDTNFGGPLFDPGTWARRPLGDVFAAYTSMISPEVDLLAVQVRAEPHGPVATSESQTVTLKAVIANSGNVSASSPITVEFYTGLPLSGTLLGIRVITSSLSGCGFPREVSTVWPNLAPGSYPIYISVTPSNVDIDIDQSNNVAVGQVFLFPARAYLPMIGRIYPWNP